MLRYAVPKGVEYSDVRDIADIAERLHHSSKDSTVVPPPHIGHVLEENHLRPQGIDDLRKAQPQVGSGIVPVTDTLGDEAPDLRCASPGEGLAWRTASHNINRFDPVRREEVEEARRVRQVAAEREGLEIRGVCLDCGRIAVSRCDDAHACLMEPEAEAACAAEDINCPGTRKPPQPTRNLTRLWREPRFKPQRLPAHVGECVRVRPPATRSPMACGCLQAGSHWA